MKPQELDRRLADLERRLAEIESRLAPPIAAAMLPPIVKSVAEPIEEPVEPDVEMPVLAPVLAETPAAPLDYAARRISAPPPKPRSGLEQAIGLKWTGWIGAVVFIVGGALAVKFAYDQGWWQNVSPWIRMGMMSLGGVALIGAGEWVFRKINIVAAASLFGAGVAVFFLVSYAGNAFYGLYSRDSAFLLMGFSVLVGAAVAVRGNMVSIGVLALIGGNVAPLVMRSEHPHIPPFLGYLLMLQAVALFLAWWGTQGKWWILRAMSLGTTSLWVAALLSDGRNLPAPAVLLGFFVLFAALYHAELILSAARTAGPGGRHGGTFVIFVTAAFMAAVLYVEWYTGAGTRGAWVLGSCAATAAAGAWLRRGKDDSPGRLLSPSYWLQSGALLVLAVPVMFKGIDVPIGWGAMALVFAAYGARVKLQSVRGFSLACWVLALIATLFQAGGGVATIGPLGVGGGASAVWMHIGGTALHDYTIIAWILALVGHAIAALNGRRRTAILADVVWAVAAVTALEPMGATLAIVIFAWGFGFAEGLDRRPRWAVHSMAMLAVATVKWALVDMLVGFWSAPNAGVWAMRYTPVMNPFMGLGLLLALSMAVEFWLLREHLQEIFLRWMGSEVDARRSLIWCAGAVIAIVSFGLSFEIARVVERAVFQGAPMVWPPGQLQQMGWTILWTAAISAFVGLAYFMESPQGRSGWVRGMARLPLIMAAKFLVVDTLLYRLLQGAAPAVVGANLQTVTALVVAGGLALSWFVGRWPDEAGEKGVRLQFSAGVLAGLVLLWCGTLEIDRAYERLAVAAGMWGRAHLEKQMAWSIFWSLFAMGSVAMGFHVRSSAVRFFGLGLFGLTLLKVVLVDLSQVGRGYRILSFMVLGLLLLGTSVLYGKLTPRLLGKLTAEI